MTVERDAIKVLARRGWTQGATQDESGRVCMLGALAEAEGHDLDLLDTASLFDKFCDSPPDSVRRVASVIREQFPERATKPGPDAFTVFRFNDGTWNNNFTDDTTIDEVLLVLDKAAVLAEEQA